MSYPLNHECIGEVTPALREEAAALCSAADYAERVHGQYWFALDACGLDALADMFCPAACLARLALWSTKPLSWLEAEAKILSGWTP